ncbi:MAG: hypothetical protein QOF63_3799, partial [Thermoanaerobaculia bacterium]|nr:hypothetical protein [Thermoanaerobaculia bacterium]
MSFSLIGEGVDARDEPGHGEVGDGIDR